MQFANVHHDFAFSIQFDRSAIHWSWRRTLKVDPFTVIAAAVTMTLKLILARFPIGRATEVRAARINYKNPVGSLVNPDAILLLPLGIYSQRIVRRKAD